MRLLVIEDDHDILNFLLKGFEEAGHVVAGALTYRDGLFLATTESFDAIVVDRLLPDNGDGLELVKTIRSQGISTPVLFLSAMANVDDRIEGFKAGGNDYITKPFAFAELLIRIEAFNREEPPAELTGDSAGEQNISLSDQIKAGKRPDVERLHKQMIERIEALERAFGALGLPGMGHNGPPESGSDAEALSKSRRLEIEDSMLVLSNQPIIPVNEPAERASLRKACQVLLSAEKSIRIYLSQTGEVFINELVRSAGAETGKWATRLAIWAALGSALENANQAVAAWLRAIGVHL